MPERKLVDKDQALTFKSDNGATYQLKVTNEGNLYFDLLSGASATDAVAMWKASEYSGSGQLLKDLSGNGHHLKFGSAHPAYVSGGVLILPGQAGNYASTPDSAAVSITGDIDIRVKVAMDDWTPGGGMAFLSKLGGSQYSYYFGMQAGTELLRFAGSFNGTSLGVDATSTSATAATDGEARWVRVTRSSASGNISFYTSVDGATWSQLGTSVSAASGALFDGTAVVSVGCHTAGNLDNLAGKVYWAEIRNGIDGPVVAKFDPSSQVDMATSWTASTGEAWTINSSTATDGSDPLYLPYTGTKHVYLPGMAGNYMSILDTSLLRVTGDLDLRVKVSLDDTTSTQWLVNKNGVAAGYGFRVLAPNNLQLFFYDTAQRTPTSTATLASHGVTNGTPWWLRATLDANNGAGQYTVRFYTSENGSLWTQLGDPVTGSTGVATVAANSNNLAIGAWHDNGNPSSAGKYYRAQIFASLDGSNKVLDVDFAQPGSLNYEVQVISDSPLGYWKLNESSGALTVKDSVGTYNGSINPAVASGITFGEVGPALTDINSRAAKFSGANNTVISIPTPPTPGSGSRSLEAWFKVPAGTWAGTRQTLIGSNWGAAAAFWIDFTAAGNLQYLDSGVSSNPANSIATPIPTDGAWHHVVAVTDATAMRQYIYLDGVSVANQAITSVANITGFGGSFMIGGNGGFWAGYTSQLAYYNTALSAARVTAHYQAASAPTAADTNKFAALTQQTVTINRSTAGRKSVLVDRPLFLFGADDFMEAVDNSQFDVNFATDSFTAIAVFRRYGGTTSYQPLIGNSEHVVINPAGRGWQLQAMHTSGTQVDKLMLLVGDGTQPSQVLQGPDGAATGGSMVVGAFTHSPGNTNVYRNTTKASVASGITKNTTTSNPLTIGRTAVGNNAAADMEFIGAAIWRRVLTDEEISYLVGEFDL